MRISTLPPEPTDTLGRVAAARPILDVDGLGRSFGDRRVIENLSIEARPGERVALVGPNGSGKTTLLRCIAGTLTPTSGRVVVEGHEAGSVDARRATGVSLAQERSFYQRLTGRSNLLFFARLRHGNARVAASDVSELVEELELSEIAEQRLDRCSSGQVQQLALARALLGRPLLLLLDEPTRSLDRDARTRVWNALEGRPGTAVLIATHLDEDLERCGTRVDLPS
jgi:ABC-type multidrug transport system ATPase subunit